MGANVRENRGSSVWLGGVAEQWVKSLLAPKTAFYSRKQFSTFWSIFIPERGCDFNIHDWVISTRSRPRTLVTSAGHSVPPAALCSTVRVRAPPHIFRNTARASQSSVMIPFWNQLLVILGMCRDVRILNCELRVLSGRCQT